MGKTNNKGAVLPKYDVHVETNKPGFAGTVITVDWWAKVAKHKGKYLDKHVYFGVQVADTEVPYKPRISPTTIREKMTGYMKKGRYHDYYFDTPKNALGNQRRV